MQRVLAAYLAVLLWIASAPADAASYEVVPTSYERNVLNSSYTYVAMVFDNIDGKVFGCSVTYTEISGRALTYSCRDRSKELRSALPASADLTTSLQSSNWLGPLPSAGFWQINAKSGDLQFCLAIPGDSDLYRPPSGCIRLDWRSAKPF
jgi:hypothetical protein